MEKGHRKSIMEIISDTLLPSQSDGRWLVPSGTESLYSYSSALPWPLAYLFNCPSKKAIRIRKYSGGRTHTHTHRGQAWMVSKGGSLPHRPTAWWETCPWFSKSGWDLKPYVSNQLWDWMVTLLLWEPHLENQGSRGSGGRTTSRAGGSESLA